ncbi:RHS repeat-associated core domain-containing protein, partial [Chryseobacterium ginsengisoli]|uniref:RHS repeat domain-containing protein n=1 Tax=Chryseobacterium ginsengisoli TaxID=363853 RepID=UPI0031ECCE10
GNAWDNKPVQFGYDANTTGDAVKKYTTVTTWANGATSSALSQSVNYGTAQLYKNTVTDEDGNVTIEFKNGEGQVLLVRKVISATENADTYYVYNEYNQLAFVIPPKAAVVSDPNSVLSDLCYQYIYDGRNRLAEKKLPGKGWEYMLYDKQDRQVGYQDANLKEQGKWLCTKYDKFGRVVYTCMLTYGETRAFFQNILDTEVNNPSNNEQRSTTGFNKSGIQIYYTTAAFPALGANDPILTVNYYDTYPTETPAVPTQILGQDVLSQDAQNSATSTKSLPVASYVKNIEDDNWTKNYTYYDKKGRTIGTYSLNHLGGYTKIENLLDFAGVVGRTNTYHVRKQGETGVFITEGFIYDDQNRLLQHYHKVDDKPEVVLADNIYNELSQLSNKTVGNNLQSIDYTYNIRGWLTKINDPANLNGKLFGYEIKYEQPQTSFWTPRYNGNISEIDWKTSQDGVQRRYVYMYDSLNRLTGGYYQEPNSSIIWVGYYNEYYQYDLNGNIKHLNRMSQPQAGEIIPSQIDDLSYIYSGNKLTSVSDSSQNLSGYPLGGNIISYDDNGNMTNHLDKGISSIQYNFLNLPKQITSSQGNTSYIYRADGGKVKKTFGNKITDYLDGFQYENATLKFLPTSEGYYNFENNKYIYNYTDHLGNIRVSFFNNGSSAEVLEENNYYPFGLKHEGYNPTVGNPAYTYSYNGKELQTESGMYDYGARMYMSDIGRWGVVDPLAEKMTRYSPYNYAFNNPIKFTDPDGREGKDWYQKDGTMQLQYFEGSGEREGYTNVGANPTVYVKGSDTASAELNNDGSATFNGKSYSNGKSFSVGPNTIITGSNENTNDGFWNSPLARFLVPDRFGVTRGASFGGGAEAGLSMGLEVITRGKDAGIYFDPGNNLSLGAAFGAGGETDLSFFSSTFTGKVSDMNLNSVVGTEAYLSGSLVDVVGVVGKVSVSFDPNPNNGPVSGRWITRSIGVAAGAKGSVGVGVTLSNTRVGIGFDGKARVADYTGAVTGKGSY